jgi:hypothetical protein
MGPIFAAGKEAQESAALFGNMVADGTAQHGVASFYGISTDLSVAGLSVSISISADLRQPG